MTERRLTVVCAHPDDEVLGCGATVRLLVNDGWRAQRIVVTQGVAGRFASEADEDSPEVRREQEALDEHMRRAGEVLGFERTEQLRFPDNRLDLVSRMDLAHALTPALRAHEPTLLLTHHPGDYNWDHTRVFDAVMMAARANVGDFFPSEIRTFEVGSSTERAWQSPDRAFHPNVYVDIEATLEAKQEAMRCYESELRAYPHPRSPEAIVHLAHKRGNEVGLHAAEAFHLVRRIEQHR